MKPVGLQLQLNVTIEITFKKCVNMGQCGFLVNITIEIKFAWSRDVFYEYL